MLQGAEWILERLYELERAKLQYEADNRRAHALTSFLRALNETESITAHCVSQGKIAIAKKSCHARGSRFPKSFAFVDLELAKRCEMKARYWADPVGWSPRQLENAHITIYEMRAALHKLLEQEKDRRHRRR